MKCHYYQNPDVKECFPPEMEGDAWFVVGKLVPGESDRKIIQEGSLVPLCLNHFDQFALDFLESMRLSMQVELDLMDIEALDQLPGE